MQQFQLLKRKLSTSKFQTDPMPPSPKRTLARNRRRIPLSQMALDLGVRSKEIGRLNFSPLQRFFERMQTQQTQVRPGTFEEIVGGLTGARMNKTSAIFTDFSGKNRQTLRLPSEIEPTQELERSRNGQLPKLLGQNFNDYDRSRRAFLTSCEGEFFDFASQFCSMSVNTNGVQASAQPSVIRRKMNVKRLHSKKQDTSIDQCSEADDSSKEHTMLLVPGLWTAAEFDGSFASDSMHEIFRKTNGSRGYNQQQARKRDIRHIAGNFKEQNSIRNSSALGLKNLKNRSKFNAISEESEDEGQVSFFISTRKLKSSYPTECGLFFKDLESIGAPGLNCPLISLKKIPRPLFDHFEISSGFKKVYRSYWMDCIERIISLPEGFGKDLGYFLALSSKIGLKEFPVPESNLHLDPNYSNFLVMLGKVSIDLDYSHIE